MHPSYYPFVRSGPACSCTHRRLAHVGTNAYGFPQADLGCSECKLCERYTPLEAIDHEAETEQYAELANANARRRELHNRILIVLFVVGVVTVPLLAVFANDLAIPWLAILVGAQLVNANTAAINTWRQGDLETIELVVQLGFSTSAFLCGFVALFAGRVPYWGIAGMLAFTAAFFILNLRQARAMTRSLNMFITDIKDEEP